MGLFTPNSRLRPVQIGDGKVIKQRIRSPYAARPKAKIVDKASGKNSRSFDSRRSSSEEPGGEFHVGSTANPSVIV